MISPIDDPRPFADVLHDWMGRHGLTSNYAVAKRLRLSHGSTVNRWREGGSVDREPAERALLDAVDEGRA